jgi:hypothetical protein
MEVQVREFNEKEEQGFIALIEETNIADEEAKVKDTSIRRGALRKNLPSLKSEKYYVLY